MKTVGQVLGDERVRLGLSLDDVESQTKVRKKYLEAIEQSNWVLFPSKTYVLGVLKSYGTYLNLDGEKLAAFFRREYEQIDSQKFKRKIAHKQLTPASKTYMKIGIIVSIILFIAYFGFQVFHLITPPHIEIIAPSQDYLPPKTEKFDFIGTTEKDSIIEINGQRFRLNDQNQFVTKIPIVNKIAKVSITVTGANGKKTTIFKTYRVL